MPNKKLFVERRTKEQLRAKSSNYYRDNRDKVLAKKRLKYPAIREGNIAYLREWRKKFPEKARESHRQYYLQNRDIVLNKAKSYYRNNLSERRRKSREYFQRNKLKIRLYQRHKRETDPNLNIKVAMRKRIWRALKNQGVRKSYRTIKFLGCSIPELRTFLSNQFKPGMSWSNYGLWHVDHIKPCALFDLTNKLAQEECFHFSNLQPLWAAENHVKSDNYASAS